MSKYTENFPKLETYDLETVFCQLKEVCGADPGGLISMQFKSRPTTAKDIALLLSATYKIFLAQNNLQEQYKKLYEFLKNYVENIDIQKYVNEWLDKILENGTLEDLLNSKVLENILKETGEIIHNYPFEWRGDLYKNYLDMIYSVAASYFVNCVNCLCVEGTPTGRNTPFFAKYNNGNTYMGLLGQGEFIYTDKELYNEVEYPVLYCDCSAFVSLLTKGRDYVNSPYYSAFNGNTTNLIDKAREIGTYWDNEYTIDFLNKIVTYWMADILNTSGCPIHKLSEYDPVTKKLTVDESEFTFLKNGDILFNANAGLTDRYRGIHHCMIYLKSLDDFNIYGQPYGVTFKPLLKEEDNESYGYIIHCDGDNGILKIETLYERMTQSARNDSTEYMYYSHAVHTAFNSSKANYKLNGLLNDYKNTYFIGRAGNAYINGFNVRVPYYTQDDYSLNAYKVRATSFVTKRGIALKENDSLNANDLEAGFYFADSANIASKIQYTPWTDRAYQLMYFSRLMDGDNSRYGVMLAFNQPTNGEAQMKIRTCGYNRYWSDWYMVTLTK